MKIQTLVFTLVMSCVSSLSLNVSMNQSAVAQTATQTQKLKALGLPLALPSYQPSGYRLTKFEIFQYKPSDSPLYQADEPLKNYQYRAIYEGPNSCSISVVSGPEVGDYTPTKTYSLGATVLGANIFSQELGEKPYPISFIGEVRHRRIFLYGRCKNSNFNVGEGKKIVRSLRIVQ